MDTEDAYQPGADGDDFEDILETFDDVEGEVEEDAPDASVHPELKKLYSQHPELILDYIETVIPKLVSKDDHRTYPFLTLYERTKIIGLRANQLSQGSQPFISVAEHVTNVREIARMELEQKRLPYIVKRPLPTGKYEYWRLADLIILT